MLRVMTKGGRTCQKMTVDVPVVPKRACVFHDQLRYIRQPPATAAAFSTNSSDHAADERQMGRSR